jgi:hypothetical protein
LEFGACCLEFESYDLLISAFIFIFVWVIGIWNLEFVWNLVLGIWIFILTLSLDTWFYSFRLPRGLGPRLGKLQPGLSPKGTSRLETGQPPGVLELVEEAPALHGCDSITNWSAISGTGRPEPGCGKKKGKINFPLSPLTM